MNLKASSNIFAAIVFILCLWAGCQLSLRKPLWADEIYTQVYTIEGSSWATILQGKTREGFNTPLYYLLQKAVLSAMNYHLPFVWTTWTDGKIADDRAQVLLRLTANGAMSLAIALIARYFFAGFSAMAAVLALISYLSSYMVLSFWAEARPYALWFLLTVMQILLLLEHSSSKPDKASKGLSVVHCLLGVTVIIGAAQIIICSAWLWFNGVKKFRQHIFLTVVPLAFCFYYFYAAQGQGTLCHYKVAHPFELMRQAFPWDRLLLLLVLGSVYWFFRRTGKFSGNFVSAQGRYLVFFALSYLFLAIALITYVKLSETHGAAGTLDSRYLIFLSPVEIISVTYFTVAVLRFLRQRHAGLWIGQFITLVSFFYVIRILLVYQDIYGRALFAY